jgi:hypothetical protein
MNSHDRRAAAFRVQRAWRKACTRRLVATRAALREMTTCVVCRDECVQLVRCANNHGCCVGCALAASDARCPLCRETRVNAAADPATPAVLAACRARLHCAACELYLDVDAVERHRAWCPRHRFVCPWSSCTQCVPAAELATHVLAHGVPQLAADADNVYQIHLVLRPSSALVFVAAGAVVVLTLEASSFRRAGAPACAHVGLRAFYSSPSAPALTARLRQLRIVDGEWIEDHRLGPVMPMLATREAIVHGAVVAVTPRAACLHDESCDNLVFAGPPTPRTLALVRRAGVADTSASAAALGPPPHALLHLLLTPDASCQASDVE